MAQNFQQVHDPFGGQGKANDLSDIFGNNNSVNQLNSEQDFFSSMAKGGSNAQTESNEMTDFFNSIQRGSQGQNAMDSSSNPLNAGLFNEDDILTTLGTGKGGAKTNKNPPSFSSGQQPATGFDQIFQATADSSQGFGGFSSQGQGYQAKAPAKHGLYDSNQSQYKVEEALKGRNLANEAISSEKKKTMFQKYVFDSYKYQVYFNTNTLEILKNLKNALWPFYPEDQPDELVNDYQYFCRRVFGERAYQNIGNEEGQEGSTGFFSGHDVDNGVHNPFNKDGDTLSFLGRDLEKEDQAANQLMVNQYKRDTSELYGPLWIFVTLVIEFIILGHLTNIMSTQANTKSEDVMNIMLQKNRSATLQRIMKLTFFFACFYLGMPFVSFCQFKGAQAMDITFMSLLIGSSYSFVPFIPGSLFIFGLQKYWRVKYFSLMLLWTLLLFNIYKTTFEARRKYFDFRANKQMAWSIVGSTFVFMWVYKSYFLQV